MIIEPRAYHALMIEDEQSSFDFVSSLLSVARPDEYQITWLLKYDDILPTIQKESFDIVLLDYQLGDFTGLDVLQLFHEHAIDLPVIMLTGRGNLKVDGDALHMGAFEYFDKSHLKATTLTRSIRYAVHLYEDRKRLEAAYTALRELEEKRTRQLADFSARYTLTNKYDAAQAGFNGSSPGRITPIYQGLAAAGATPASNGAVDSRH